MNNYIRIFKSILSFFLVYFIDCSCCQKRLFSKFIPQIPPSRNVLNIRWEHELGQQRAISGINAVIFGGSGFIGQNLVWALGRIGSNLVIPHRSDGHNIRYLKMFGAPGRIILVPCLLRDPDRMEYCCSNSDVVINCYGREYKSMNFNWNEVHREATVRVAKAAKKAGVKRFIQLSHINADPMSDSEYFRCKGQADEALKVLFPEATILKLCNVYGREDHYLHGILNNIVKAYNPFFPLFKNMQKVQPVYVNDVVTAILAVLSNEYTFGRTYELGGPEIYTKEQVIRFMADVMHESFIQADISQLTVEMWGWLQHLLSRWNRPLFIEDTWYQHSYDAICNDGSLTFDDLNIQPIKLNEHIQHISMWIHSNRHREDARNVF